LVMTFSLNSKIGC